jgi:DNA-binding FadR family transcriptional regulator
VTEHEALGLDTYFRPVRSGNAFEDTVQRLLQIIRLGIIGPGESLPPERELAGRLAVSRDTLREAIGALSQAGFVVSKRGRYGGTLVVDELPSRTRWVDRSGHQVVSEWPSAEVVQDTLAVREVLEVGIARQAARASLSAAERERLWSRLQASQAAGSNEYRRLDAKLHLSIAELTGAPTLVALLADNRMLIDEYLDNIPLLPPNIGHSNHQHEQIVVAILAGDEARAASVMCEHLDGSAALLRGFLA